jgi:GNAT superfamily N-acetyltransferase
MRDVIQATWGWDEAWQQADFDKRFASCEVSVIEVDGRAAGSLWLDHRPESLHIRELQLLPEFQGRGLGTKVVEYVIDRAADVQLPVPLCVVAANPRARRLYERLGFIVVGVEPPFIHMQHKARTGGAV